MTDNKNIIGELLNTLSNLDNIKRHYISCGDNINALRTEWAMRILRRNILDIQITEINKHEVSDA